MEQNIVRELKPNYFGKRRRSCQQTPVIGVGKESRAYHGHLGMVTGKESLPATNGVGAVAESRACQRAPVLAATEGRDNVEAMVELTNPRDHERCLGFVKAKITGEAKTKLLARTAVDSWEGVRDVLDENYVLANEKVLLVVRSKSQGFRGLCCLVEAVLEEESNMVREKQLVNKEHVNIGRMRVANDRITCGNCNKVGHRTEKSFLKQEIKTERQVQLGIVCYKCGRCGHMRINCRMGEKREVNTAQPTRRESGK
ncbi:hypothetical protein PR048_016255 [Dryococelus australis]|uniref:CCHC-type domain-containing protein n=1 Tax=Dryococelus australis TaxID=614101 RepID=A0ABQ9HJ77_9NEOP|nr:hypothetical protein PR048_016255 [Dryococelus australis]